MPAGLEALLRLRLAETLGISDDAAGALHQTRVALELQTVRAERKWSPAEGQDVVVAERPQGTFTRQLFLGESLDTDRVAASYDQGVLTLRIPVAEQAKPRKVEVTAGADAQPAISTSG